LSIAFSIKHRTRAGSCVKGLGSPVSARSEGGRRMLLMRQFWNKTNSHRVDLTKALVEPQQMMMIERRAKDTIVDVWLVLKEVANGDGFLVFYKEDLDTFG
jgi:hypothetical protein